MNADFIALFILIAAILLMVFQLGMLYQIRRDQDLLDRAIEVTEKAKKTMEGLLELIDKYREKYGEIE